MNREDIIRMAQDARIPLNLTDERVTLKKLELFGELYATQKGNTANTRGFWIFWLRPEGGTYRRGINLTICRGFILCLVTSKHKYRFRFRHSIKPRFMWSKGDA